MTQIRSNVFVNLNNAPTVNNKFDSKTLWQMDTTKDATIMNSFAYAYRPDPEIPVFCYIVQYKNSGAKKGQLCITKVDPNGNNIGHMYLTDYSPTTTQLGYDENPYNYFYYHYTNNGSYSFGQGLQISVEYAPDGHYIWLDFGASVINETNSPYNEGLYDTFGTSLCRFKFVNGATIKANDSRIQRLSQGSKLDMLQADAGKRDHWIPQRLSISFDTHYKQVAVCFIDDNEMNNFKCRVYDYNYTNYQDNKPNTINFTFKKEFTVPIVEWSKINQNVRPSTKKYPLPLKGHGIFGDYMYFLNGTPYNTHHKEYWSPTKEITDSPKLGNTHLTRYNWKTGVISERLITEAGKSDVYREPRGLQIVPNIDASNEVKSATLHFGFSGGETGNRHWSIFSKKSSFK